MNDEEAEAVINTIECMEDDLCEARDSFDYWVNGMGNGFLEDAAQALYRVADTAGGLFDRLDDVYYQLTTARGRDEAPGRREEGDLVAEKTIPQLACTFDLETWGLDPVYGRLLVAVIKPWQQDTMVFQQKVASSDDSAITKAVVEELNKYAILIAHNGMYFDVRFLNGRALQYGLPVINPNHKLIDPCQIARKHLNLPRNSLDAIAKHMQLDEQKMHIGPEVWVHAALDHDKEAMATLVERCESDVRVLEAIAARALPLTRSINAFGSA